MMGLAHMHHAHRCGLALALLVGTAMATPTALAAPLDSPAAPSRMDALSQSAEELFVIATGKAAGALETTGQALAAAWRFTTSFVLPEAPFHYLPEQMSEGDLSFIGAMEIAGLTFVEMRTGGGLLPDASYRFVASREPTAHDLQRAWRHLNLHRERFGDLRALGEQRILQTVLEAVEGGGLVITELEITVRPWPSIRYVLSARDRPLDDGQRRLLEQLRELTRAPAR